MNLFDKLCNKLLNAPIISEAVSDIGDRDAELKGDKTEAAFAKILRDKYYRGFYTPNPKPGELEAAYQQFQEGNADWFQATPQQDRIDHLDFGIREGKTVTTFEVKGNKDHILKKVLSKALRMRNADPSKAIFVELQGVTGHPGWIYGKADWVAFQNEDVNSFTMWTLPAIRKVVEKHNLANSPIVPRIEDAIYARYQRPGKRDFVTIIPASEVIKMGGSRTIFR